MADEPPFDPAAPLSAIPAWSLEVSCACGRMRQISMKFLIRQHGPHARAPALVARKRCKQRCSRPASAEWIDNPAGGALGSGYPPKKRVPLALPGDASPPLPRRQTP